MMNTMKQVVLSGNSGQDAGASADERYEVAEPMAETSLFAQLLSIFACPGEVFEEVAVSAPRVANWLVPTLLVGLTSLMLLVASRNKEQTEGVVQEMVKAGEVSFIQAETVSGAWEQVSVTAVWVGAFAGTFWSAWLLWFMGRVLLKTRFSYWKALEVAGLTGSIAALGTLVTVLLVVASGDTSARPALSLLARHLSSGSPVHLVLEGLNGFHLWTTAVLAIGLSRLAGVSFKEAGFWVFGYWLFARMAGAILAC